MKLLPISFPGMLLTCLLFAVGCAGGPAPSVPVMSAPRLDRKITEDLRLIRRYDEGLKAVVIYAQNRPGLFPADDAPASLSLEHREELRTIWRAYLDYMRAVDGIKEYWDDYRHVVDDDRGDAYGFLVSYTAWLVQYRHGLDFLALTVPGEAVATILDEGTADHDVPEGSFGNLRWRVINVESMARRAYYRQYWKAQRDSIEKTPCGRTPECEWAFETVDQYHDLTGKQLEERGGAQWSYQTFDFMRDATFDAWFPVQREVATWMGDTKVHRKDSHLIGDEQIETLAGVLSPGDILVTRQNWYLSNVGLPGFWPHSALYVGSPTELEEHFDGEDVRAAIAEISGEPESLVSYLRRTHPLAWSAFTAGAEDEPARVIEAVSEGVVFHPLEKTASVDYLGALRPRASKVEKALAIARAFGLHGRAYDFNFDFLTDDVLVCTELVYKAWQTPANPKGLPIELVQLMGRTTLPANELVRQFDETYDTPDRPFDFVYFLDGLEKQRKAVVGDVKDFRKSWKRPKWDVSQK